jgi:signal transduction histidine kinase
MVHAGAGPVRPVSRYGSSEGLLRPHTCTQAFGHMGPQQRSLLLRYAAALAATGAAVALQRLIWPYVPPSPQLLFYPAILAAAWFGGFGPGVLSVALSCTAIAYWFLPPVSGLAIETPSDALDLGIFAAIGVVTAGLLSRTTGLVRKARAAWAETEAARVRLDEACRAREEVLAIVSHDLRSPLSAIELTCTQLRRGPLGEKESVAPQIDRIERAARRMDVLVRNLLDAATIDAGALRLQSAPFQVRALVDETVKLFKPVAEHKAISLDTDVRTDESLLCDGARILQTLENLVGNALKFVPRGGRVSVLASLEAGAVRFEIRDSGPGIATEELLRVFDRHWTRGDGTGSGLGLYIAKAVVEAHGGRIWAMSNGGTTMSFTIPQKTAIRVGQAERVAARTNQSPPPP